jgi:hypothetical protein
MNVLPDIESTITVTGNKNEGSASNSDGVVAAPPLA